MEECAYRLEVVTEFLKAGIPIAKTDMLRSLAEKNGYRLTGSSNLGQYVSMALKQEIEQIKQELEMPGQVGMTRDISVIFDGSTRQGEAIAIIVRFMDNDWNITQRLVRIEVCSKSVNANQLAQVLNQCLSVEYGARSRKFIACRYARRCYRQPGSTEHSILRIPEHGECCVLLPYIRQRGEPFRDPDPERVR